ncbi:Myosin heavy chain kinase [Seminavis robusta]|uniref:Myosin heavy chain kinase n=1 Tax=Seminavis robusta TaxID=568900 RepID=A0A9N8HWX2_9STRA|nr:Myosin heavy chain kinase [Seminavis robusta]|eukprot:Sro2066_g313260.1 Myosin heavy chain kinase (336) ;mRNA; r:4080-5087
MSYNGGPPGTKSVQCLGSRNPSDTVEIRRRATEQGVVDLITKETNNSRVSSSFVSKRSGSEFSTPSGKRRKTSNVTTNLSTHCTTIQSRWSQGAFRWVHKGRYVPNPRIPGHNGGPQNGELCVIKEFKTGSVYEESFFQNDIKAVDKADSIIYAFNGHCFTGIGAKTIHLNKPAIWEDVHPDATGRKSKKLVEPMLEGEFLKFNSNSGYTNGADFMQEALSHFSYHHTGCKFLLCDLQGGHYADSYVLTDPVIMSADNEKAYGATDLGKEGIDNFFAHHRCNRYCHAHWKKPQAPQASSRIPRLQSTSMSLALGTKKSEDERKKKLEAILDRKHW